MKKIILTIFTCISLIGCSATTKNKPLENNSISELEKGDFTYLEGKWKNNEGDVYHISIKNDQLYYELKHARTGMTSDSKEYGNLKIYNIRSNFVSLSSSWGQWSLQLIVVPKGVEIDNFPENNNEDRLLINIDYPIVKDLKDINQNFKEINKSSNELSENNIFTRVID